MAPPAVMIVFGATGDLTGRKLIPALHELALRHELPSAFSMVGVARTPFDDEEFRSFVRDAAAKYGKPTLDRDEVWRNVTEKFRYVCGEYDRDDTFARLAVVLDEVDRTEGTAGNRVHYLAIPPSGFATVVEHLGRQRLNRASDADPDAFVRIAIEKPYGRDLASAQQLDTCVHAVFDESQVYRIDHYLGKGDGPEHPGVAVRQRHLRADLELSLRRLRPGDRRRTRRCGSSRLLLRRDGGAP